LSARCPEPRCRFQTEGSFCFPKQDVLLAPLVAPSGDADEDAEKVKYSITCGSDKITCC
jgi:hypothetical protein